MSTPGLPSAHRGMAIVLVTSAVLAGGGIAIIVRTQNLWSELLGTVLLIWGVTAIPTFWHRHR